MSNDLAPRQNKIEVMTAITVFFVLEMSLRMLVLGPARQQHTVYA